MVRPAGPTEAQRTQWNEQGYLVIEQAIQGDELHRLQDAFNDWADRCKSNWLDRVAAGEVAATYYDIPNVLEKDELFINLVDHPSYYGLLKAFTDDQLLFQGPQARTVPPWPVSYSGWHPDVPRSNPLHIKVQVYVTDVEPRTGEFAYVPGSHKPDAGPYFKVHRSESMPGHKTFPGTAGTAIIFNSYGWHAAMDNHTDIPRKSIILIYEKRTPGRVDPSRFASIAHSCTTPERRALFCLEA
ncbi:MAG: phytanoyl-CoA dioxygenase family protein [Candidatus Latescibacteria bacterium]|nr:phytanoyl-CoA dioxygenase family protein [Candidatus Latescibacterota bacterium]